MIRFDLFRQKTASYMLAALMAFGVMTSIPQASFANDWTDMLKPLVKDVLVPSATKGMKRLLQLEEQKHPGLTQSFTGTAPSTSYTTSTTATVATPTTTASSTGMDQFFSNSSSPGSTDPLSSPEEPMSTASNTAGAMASTLTASNTASAGDAVPPPPPPVATP